MHRRRTTRLSALAALVALVTATVAPAGAEEPTSPSPAETGSFSIVFRPEDATYLAEDGTWRSIVDDAEAERGDNGCLTADDGTQDCLPAAATSVGLASGDVLYWNALQGTENLSPTQSAVPAGGNIAENEDSRLLRLRPDDPARSTVAVPVNPSGFSDADRGGAEEQGLVPDPTQPGTFIRPTNPDGTPPNSNGLFCSDQLHLSSGQIIAVGGTNYYSEPSLHDTLRVAGLRDQVPGEVPVEDVGVIELEGTRDARIFDPAAGEAGAWMSAAPMEYGRWYPSAITLPDGDVLVGSGVTKLIKPIYTDDEVAESGDNVPYLERFDPETGTWSVDERDGEQVSRTMPLYPRYHLLPNGNVYYDAAGQAFNPAGQSYAEALWNIAATYDPEERAWTDLGVPGLQGPDAAVDPAGNLSEPGFRGSTFSAMLPLRPGPDGSYDEAAVLSAGGVLLPTPGSVLPTASSRVNQVHIGPDGEETLETIPTDPLGRARWYGSGVVLPNGQVALFNGADLDGVVAPGSESPIRQVELFTPTYAEDDATVVTGGTWDDAAMQTRGRTYHNSAILLPDASVLVGGHAPIPNGYFDVRNNPDVPGVRDFANNFRDASFEIYYPPYLHRGERPEIRDADDSVANDRVLSVTASDGIESLVLVRNPAYTHLIDGDQRSVELAFERVDQGRGVDVLRADVPGPEVVPPGPYMVFVNQRVDGELVPSISHQVFVGADAPEFARDGAGDFASTPVFDPPAPPADEPADGSADEATAQPLLPVEAPSAPQIASGEVLGASAGDGAQFAPAAAGRGLPVVPLGLGLLALTLGVGLAVARSRREVD